MICFLFFTVALKLIREGSRNAANCFRRWDKILIPYAFGFYVGAADVNGKPRK